MAGPMSWLRLSWRLQRWEIAFVTLACLTLGANASYQAIEMRSLLASCGGGSIGTIPCSSSFVFQDRGGTVELLMMLAAVLPFAVGIVLGVPVVAREIEQRTAPMAWMLARSRARWLAWRTLPILMFALVAVSLPAFAAEQMIRARWPHDDVGFLDYGAYGVPLVMRAVLALAISVGLGALIGRSLPALLVGVALSVALGVALNLALPVWVPAHELATTTEAELESTSEVNGRLGVRSVSVEYRMPDGTLIGEGAAQEIIEAAYEAAGGSEPDRATLPQLVIHEIAPDRYPDVVIRESVGLGAATLVPAGVAAVVVHRRRPG